MFSWGIKQRVLCLALVPTAIISLLLSAYFIYLRIQDLEDRHWHQGTSLVLQLAQKIQSNILEEQHVTLPVLAKSLFKDPSLLGVAIYTRDGQELEKAGQVYPYSRPKDIIRLPTTMVYYQQYTDRLSLMMPLTLPYSTKTPMTPLNPGAENTSQASFRETGWIKVELEYAGKRLRQYQEFIHSGIIVLLGLSVSALFAQRMGRSVTRPIFQLAQTVEQIKEGRFIKAEHHYKDWEFAVLETGLNTMATALQLAQEDMQSRIEQATLHLRQTLSTIEVQKIDLELARKEAETASQVKSEFLANMSHEIRTPLNGIIGFINLLRKTELHDKQKDYLSIIQKSATSLLAIINDILDFSKLEAGKLHLDRTPMNLQDCVEETLTLLAPNAHEKGLELVVLTYSDVPSRMIGDPLRIKQVLTNLASNAIKFTDQGTVVIRVMLEKIQNDQITLCISVTDTGLGIPLEEQKELFHAFSQGNTGAHRKFGGTGLGLVISKKLVEHMQGELGLESEEGQGSTFWFTFKVNTFSDPQEENTENHLHGMEILLFESHPMTRLALSHLFTTWGMHCHEIEIIEQLRPKLLEAQQKKKPIQMIILGMNRLENIKSQAKNIISDIQTYYNGPIGVIANTTDYHIYDEILKVGADFYLSKPVGRRKLYDTLRTIYQREIDVPSLPEAVETAQPVLPASHILAVDDNPANLQLIAALLEDMGLTVSTANNGISALDLVKQKSFDLILMDIRMPGMDGIETSRAIRHLKKDTRKIAIVALTAHASHIEKEAILAAGIEEVLLKPIDAKELHSVISKWLPQEDQSLAIDWSLAEKLAGGKKELAEDMVRILVSTLPGDQKQINDAFAAKDLNALREYIHRLHGACCYCGVPRLKAVVRDLEVFLTESTDLQQIEDKLKLLNQEIDYVLNTAASTTFPII